MKTLVTLLIPLMTISAARGDELDLQAAIQAALAGHPELAAASAEADAAAADARQAGAWTNPAVFMRLEGAPRRGDAWNDAGRIVGLSQAVPLGGRLGADRALGEARSRTAQLTVEARAQDLESRVRQVYAAALHAERTVGLQAEAVAVSRDLLALVKHRTEAGDAPESAYRRARMAATTTLTDLAAARAERAAALAELSALIGRTLPETVTLLDTPLETAAADDGQAIRERVARARAEAATAAVTLAGRERWPELGLEAGLRSSPEGDGFDAGISLDLPLWDRGAARLQAARARQVAAAHQAESTSRTVSARRAAAQARHEAAESAVRTYVETVVPDAEATLTATKTAFALGDVDLTEVLQITREWIGVRQARLDHERDLALAVADLMRWR